MSRYVQRRVATLACIIVAGSGNVACPTGRNCVVQCPSKQRCTSTITCAPDAGCVVECTATQACDGVAIEQNGATKLCLRCVGQACNSVTCNANKCSKVCSSGGSACNSSCENCANVSACP